MTSPTPTTTTPPGDPQRPTDSNRPTDPNRPAAADQAALFDAIATEHAAIYGYGMVSAHSSPEENSLVASALAQHRQRREDAIALLTGHSAQSPIPAAGYELPIPVGNPTDAANLAVRIEDDCATAWRAVIEHAATEQDRAFGATALTASAVLSAQWKQILGSWPITVAFPGGNE